MKTLLHIVFCFCEVLSVVTYQEPNRFRHAVVNSIHDGDTVKLTIDIGDGLKYTTACRLKGINARELSNKPGGQEDREFLGTLLDAFDFKDGLARDDSVVVELFGDDKYGRKLVRLWVRDPKTGTMLNVNEMMVQHGHAVKYMDDGK